VLARILLRDRLHYAPAKLPPVRRLIFNADDFGLTLGVNRSVVEAHTHGVLTSATLMANTRASADAAKLAHAHPRLGVGCHVVLVDGEPLTDPARIPSLVPSSTSRFRSSIADLATRALCGRLDQHQIEAEATAQFRTLQAEGLAVTHFDTHKHAHIFPSVLQGLLRAARTCGIRALRNPFEPQQSLSRSVARGQTQWNRSFQTQVLRVLRPRFEQLVKRSGLKTTDGTVGIAATGSLDSQQFAHILEYLPEGTWEFVCHPGYCDDDLRAAGTRLLDSRLTELQLLTAPETRTLIERAGIQLISYADL
jgi:chitin disaccharide deacetylase